MKAFNHYIPIQYIEYEMVIIIYSNALLPRPPLPVDIEA